MQAEEDLKAAYINYENKLYGVAAFLCQQSVEKALKAVLLKQTGKIRKIHDLVILAKDINLPEPLCHPLKELTFAYIYTRYPIEQEPITIKGKLPSFITAAKDVLQWAKKNL